MDVSDIPMTLLPVAGLSNKHPRKAWFSKVLGCVWNSTNGKGGGHVDVTVLRQRRHPGAMELTFTGNLSNLLNEDVTGHMRNAWLQLLGGYSMCGDIIPRNPQAGPRCSVLGQWSAFDMNARSHRDVPLLLCNRQRCVTSVVQLVDVLRADRYNADDRRSVLQMAGWAYMNDDGENLYREDFDWYKFVYESLRFHWLLIPYRQRRHFPVYPYDVRATDHDLAVKTLYKGSVIFFLWIAVSSYIYRFIHFFVANRSQNHHRNDKLEHAAGECDQRACKTRLSGGDLQREEHGDSARDYRDHVVCARRGVQRVVRPLRL